MKVNILGVRIDNLKKGEVWRKIEKYLSGQGQHFITTPNPEMVVAAQKDKKFLEILNKADLAVPDGFGLILASRYLRHPIPERITGVDLMLDICGIAEQKNCSVYFLGGEEGVARETARVLVAHYAQLRVAGAESGGVINNRQTTINQQLLRNISDARPDILFVALGAEKQEKWIAQNLAQLPSIKIAMGVGGAFDFIAGKQRRAPDWIRKIGMEWMWRLFMQPWRWKRILTATIKFSWLVLKNGKNKNNMSDKKIRTRFAPSPTGYLHVGSLRTALYNFLFARKNKGEFLLRIEDTDRARFVPGSDEQIIKILNDFSLTPDNKETVYQSKRLEIYKKFAEQLIDEGSAYYCFCSEEELAKNKENQNAAKQPPGYWGNYRKCNKLNKNEARQRAESGEKHVIRFRMLPDDNRPQDTTTAWTDLIHGEIPAEMKFQEDFVIIKSDGFPTYNFANVIDDHLMEITHVIRGDEFLSSTIKHIKLYETLNFDAPQFAHLPLILNPDRSKLSKRQGDVAVEDYLQKGYLPEALINFVAFLGWNPKTDREIFSLNELVEEFSIGSMNKSGAIFNIDKLNWFNGNYIRNMDLDALTDRCIIYLEKSGLISGVGDEVKNSETGEIIPRDFLKKIVALEQERLVKLGDLPDLVSFFFKKDLAYNRELLIWKKMTAEEAVMNLTLLKKYLEEIPASDFTKDAVETTGKRLIEENNLKAGEVLWPFRAAITGLEASPPPFDVAEILGKEKTLERINKAISVLG